MSENDNKTIRPQKPAFDKLRLIEAVLSTTEDFAYIFSPDGRILYANRRLLEVWGRSESDAIGKRLPELGYEAWHAEMHHREIAQVIATKQPIKGEVPFTGGSGISGIYEYIFSPVFGADGQVEIIAGTTRDVTSRKRAEERAATILESITDAFFAVDADFQFTFLNSQREKLLRHTAAELLGQSMWTAYPDLYDSDFGKAYRQAASDRQTATLTAFYPAHDRWYEVHIYPSAGDDRGLSVYFRDSSQQKRAEAAIRASEARFRELADAMPQIVWSARPDGQLDYYNRRWFQFIGVEGGAPPQVLDWAQYVHPDDLPRAAQTWAESLKRGDRYQAEFRVRNGSGEYRTFLVRATPAHDGAQRIARWYGTCTDIEDRQRARGRDQLLLALDEATRPLTDSAQITATYARLLGQYLAVDRCAYADVEADEDTFNLTGDYCNGVSSAIGRYRFSQFGDEVLRRMRENLPFVVDDVDHAEPPIVDRSAYDAMQIQAVICVPMHKGEKFVAAMAVHQKVARQWRQDEVELVMHVAARCWESIERARIERGLRESEQRFRTMANSAPVLVWMAGPDQASTWFNQPWLDFTGRSMTQEIGSGWADGIHADDRTRYQETFRTAFDLREPFKIDFRLRRHDGEYRWISDYGVPLSDPTGAFAGYIGSCVDITDRKRIETERQSLLDAERAARSEAERIGHLKDEFLATLSHELRTPLNAILGWSGIIRNSKLDEAELLEGVDTIERNARAQTQIVDDLLDMSRIVSGKVRLDVQRLDPAPLVRAAAETVRPAADAKGIRVQLVLDPLAGPVSGDPNRLQQVLWNLLTNAIKFTPRGGRVQVLLERVNSHIEISVIDTGEGIKPDFLPHVFDRFRQADASTTRLHGGLGLGLSIVRQLVELHGGTIRAKSPGVGAGSTFTVMLPLTVIHPEPGSESDRRHPEKGVAGLDLASCSELNGVRILVVDDEIDARALVKRFLEDCNATVTTAASVDQALDRLKEEPFDVLVSDIGMPGRDGYDLMQTIRASSAAPSAGIPAIALTAYARGEDRVKSIVAGFDMHMSKPVDPAELIAMVASLAKRRRIMS